MDFRKGDYSFDAAAGLCLPFLHKGLLIGLTAAVDDVGNAWFITAIDLFHHCTCTSLIQHHGEEEHVIILGRVFSASRWTASKQPLPSS